MPSWPEYVATSRARGALAFELFVVRSVPAQPPEALREVLPEHLAYQKQLEADGALFMAGPMSDERGEMMTGEGMIVLRAESMQAARVLAEADPMHSSGARSYTIRRWLLNEGGLRLTVALSEQQVALA
ncbi:YciI family protein [Alkalilacustris brevis]|uniref:YciI family protein n=1 Tax=Alkalilacustris brevis TaxID=2026338 RepID=UPI000E0D5FE4|nr:YciI family protein [Alkalilacustris brevis]